MYKGRGGVRDVLEKKGAFFRVEFSFLTFGDTPAVLSALDFAAVGRHDILGGADNSKGHSSHHVDVSLGCGLVLTLHRARVDLDLLRSNDVANLHGLLMLGDAQESKGDSRFFFCYILLEFGQVSRSQGVRFCNDRDQIDTRTQALHTLDIQRRQTVSWSCKRISFPPIFPRKKKIALTYGRWA